MKTSTWLVLSIFACVIGYTVAALLIQYLTASPVSDTLTVSWFSFWGLEAGVLGKITWTKERKKKDG